ncbi:MAG: restriction endonuclease subunit S [Saprospiraceae bacterium]|nr:restriction endonuclease subunit S [Saprospiraceae bacterium]
MKINVSKYPFYKDSGVEWLGKIPEHWEILPGLSFIFENKERNKGMIRNTILCLSYGNIRVKGEEELTGLVPESFETYQFVNKSDLIVRPTDLQNDRVSLRSSISEYDGIITNAYLNLRFKSKANSKFFHYFFRAIDNNKVIYGLGSGLRQNISYLDFRRFQFPFPPLPEQTAIARFLDEKTTLINKAIAIKQKQIELLKERRQILIHKVVTHGLDPNVKMKDSGVEWIGEIPDGWEVKKLRYLAYCFPSNVDKHSKSNEKDVRLCNYTDVYKNDYITDDMDLMNATASDDQITKFSLKVNDIVITKDSETASDIAVPTFIKEKLTNVVCGYHLAIIRTHQDNYSKYLFQALKTKLFNAQFEICSNGITRVGLGNSDLKNGTFLVPSPSEQIQIAEFIERSSSKIANAISLKEKEIEKLKEYKATLINSAVTGKIKVS